MTPVVAAVVVAVMVAVVGVAVLLGGPAWGLYALMALGAGAAGLWLGRRGDPPPH